MSAEPGSRTAVPRRKRSRVAIAWVSWIALRKVSAAGLRHYRNDNPLSEWVPERRSKGPIQTYLVVGGPGEAFGMDRVVPALQQLDSVAWRLDAGTLAIAGPLASVSAEDFLVSRDGRWIGIYVFRAEAADDGTFVREVREVIDRQAADPERIAIGGPAVFHAALNDFSQRRLPAIMLGILLVGGIVVWHITGSFTTGITTQAAVTLSQLVLLGAVSWRRIPMDMSLSMVPPLMMALGFSYAAHRALRPGAMPTLVLCWLTTALGFGTFALADLAPMRAFAGYSVFGLTLVWSAVITLVRPIPAERRPDAHHPRWLHAARRAGWCLACRAPGTIVVLAIVLSLSGIVALCYLRLETDPLRYFPRHSLVYRDFKALDRHLTGMLPFQVELTGDVDAGAVLRRTPGVRKVVDVTTLTQTSGRLYWCLADNDALPQLKQAEPTWQAWARQQGTQLHWRGVGAQLAAVDTTVRRTAIVALPLMALLTAVVIGCQTRNAKQAAISLWVNLVPIIALAAVTVAARWPLGLPAMMIGAIATGIAVDDTLHLLAALRTWRSLRRAYVWCWRPCVGSSLVAAICVMLFVLSPFRPTAQFGSLLALAIFVAALADFLLLPAMLHQTTVQPSARCDRVTCCLTTVVPAARGGGRRS